MTETLYKSRAIKPWLTLYLHVCFKLAQILIFCISKDVRDCVAHFIDIWEASTGGVL